jgi:hypothetical protein
MKNRPVAGRSSETWSHPIDMNNNPGAGEFDQFCYGCATLFALREDRGLLGLVSKLPGIYFDLRRIK